jgi:hypothetical protein
MIVVEGMDNTGKSTLVNSISSRLGLPIIKSPVELIFEERYEEWIAWIETTLVPEQDHYVHDRYPIFGEYIYGPILRGVNLLETTNYRERWLQANPLIIYCRPATDRIFNFGERAQMVGIKPNAKLILERYDEEAEILRKQGFTILDYNYLLHDIEKLIKKVCRYLNGRPIMKILQGEM